MQTLRQYYFIYQYEFFTVIYFQLHLHLSTRLVSDSVTQLFILHLPIGSSSVLVVISFSCCFEEVKILFPGYVAVAILRSTQIIMPSTPYGFPLGNPFGPSVAKTQNCDAHKTIVSLLLFTNIHIWVKDKTTLTFQGNCNIIL